MNSIDQKIETIPPKKYPRLLREALRGAKNVPECLFIRGELPSDDYIFLTVVGSRRYSDYGRAACEALIAGLRGLPVVIVSGLAFGIDSIAHEAALKHGLKTVAVPGSGLADEMIYPADHIGLARRILAAGGCLLSPFAETTMGNNWTFPYRNRIMAGMAQATLVVEANLKSGTLITAEHAIGFNRDLLVVPGSIFSKKSEGPHLFLKDGATPITSAEDLVVALGLESFARKAPDHSELSAEELLVLKSLAEPLSRDALVEKLGLGASRASALISSLEMKGLIEEKLGELRLVDGV